MFQYKDMELFLINKSPSTSRRPDPLFSKEGDKKLSIGKPVERNKKLQ